MSFRFRALPPTLSAAVLALACSQAMGAPPPAAGLPPPVPLPPGPAPSADETARFDAEALTFYPAAARSAGIEGSASLVCDLDLHAAPRNCVVSSETPQGQGFGRAALDLAAQAPGQPKVQMTPQPGALHLTIAFSLHPPAVTPNLLRPRHVIMNPRLLQGPSAAQMQAAYPAAARKARLEGAVRLACVVLKTGALSGCAVAAEEPLGHGFGAAALTLAPDFLMAPRLLDGDPVDGGKVVVPIRFKVVG